MVKNVIKKTLAIFCFMLTITFTSMVSAEVPSGDYQLDLRGDWSIWDVTGNYDTSELGLGMSFHLVMDAQGKFTGSGYADVYAEDLYMDFNITGSVKTSGNVTWVNMTMKFQGEYFGEPFKGNAKVKTEVDIENALMTGTMTVSVMGERATVDFEEPFPADMTGNWSMAMHIEDVNGKTLAGNGWVELSNGVKSEFEITGKYNVKKNLADLTLKSKDAALKGNQVKLSKIQKVQVLSGSVLSGKISYKLFGQKGSGDL
jgi:hypothetical protein